MNVTLHIPDDLASGLTAAGGDLSRRALEALAAEEYRHDRITKPELQRLLGIETSFSSTNSLRPMLSGSSTQRKTPSVNVMACNAWASDAPGTEIRNPFS